MFLILLFYMLLYECYGILPDYYQADTASAKNIAISVLVEHLLFQHTQRHIQRFRLAVYSWKIVLRFATCLYQ